MRAAGWLLVWLFAAALTAADPAEDALRRAAEAGDPEAEVRLGSAYFNGVGMV